MNRWLGIIVAGALALGAALPGRAAAQDFGIGLGALLGNLQLTGAGAGVPVLGGLEGTFWINDDIAIDFIASMGTVARDGGDARFDLGLSAGFLYALAQGGDTKFELGARLGIAAVINESTVPDANDDDANMLGEVLFRIEHWFDDQFTLAGLVGLSIVGDPDDTVGFAMALGAQGGLTVTYYFMGDARPGDGSASPPPESGGYGGGGGGGGGDTSGGDTGGGAGGGAESPPDPESGAAGW